MHIQLVLRAVNATGVKILWLCQSGSTTIKRLSQWEDLEQRKHWTTLPHQDWCLQLKLLSFVNVSRLFLLSKLFDTHVVYFQAARNCKEWLVMRAEAAQVAKHQLREKRYHECVFNQHAERLGVLILYFQHSSATSGNGT